MTLLIADDHFPVRVGLKTILQADAESQFTIHEASSLAEVRVVLARVSVDLILLDIQFSDGNGLDLVRDLQRENPKLPVLILSMYQEGSFVLRALQHGAKGFLCKESAGSILADAIVAVRAGHVFLDPVCLDALAGTLKRLPEGMDHRDFELKDLTSREKEVFALLALGETSKAIAHRLGLSSKTVDNYRVSLLAKLNLGGTAELMRFAIEKKLF